jgi:hypothetical protein
MSIAKAFHKVCSEVKEAVGHYVVLMETAPYYGGPEEGGWCGEDKVVVAYQKYATKEAADNAAKAVEKMAEELNQEAKKTYGKQCLLETEWLEARGLEDSYLKEPDGETVYSVYVTDTLPENKYGSRHYS